MFDSIKLRTFKNLCEDKLEQEKAKYDVDLLKQHIFYKQLPYEIKSLQIPTELIIDPVVPVNVRCHLQNHYQKIIQKTKSDLLTIHIAIAEACMREWQNQFNNHTDRMKRNQDERDMFSDERLTPIMIEIMQRRFKFITERIQRLYKLKVDFFHQSFNGHFEENTNHQTDIHTQPIGCSPSLIIDTDHHLSIEQVLFLSRGPTYVPSCQMHVLPSLPQDQIYSKQMGILQKQLSNFFSKYPIGIDRKPNFEKDLKTLFKENFSSHLPTFIQQRALYERKLVQSIYLQLKKDQLILRRTADHNNVFYLGHANDFEQKSNDYMNNNATSYELIGRIDENNSEQTQLNEIIKSINQILNNMHASKQINEEHLNKMKAKTSNVRLPYLYFLPEVQQVGRLITLKCLFLTFVFRMVIS